MEKTMNQDRICPQQCFQFVTKELWRDGKGRGLSELVEWVRNKPVCTGALGQLKTDT